MWMFLLFACVEMGAGWAMPGNAYATLEVDGVTVYDGLAQQARFGSGQVVPHGPESCEPAAALQILAPSGDVAILDLPALDLLTQGGEIVLPGPYTAESPFDAPLTFQDSGEQRGVYGGTLTHGPLTDDGALTVEVEGGESCTIVAHAEPIDCTPIAGALLVVESNHRWDPAPLVGHVCGGSHEEWAALLGVDVCSTHGVLMECQLDEDGLWK